MSTDFQGREPTITPNSDAPLFAANPVWERSRKKKSMLGGRKTTAPMTAQAPMAEPGPAPMASDRLAPDGLSPDRVAAEPRSFAAEEPAMILDRPVDRPFAAGTGATTTHSTLAASEPMAAARHPAAARTARTGNAGPSAALIAGGVAAVALVAVGGWYAMAPRDGVPELAPGQVTTSEVAAAPIVAAQGPAEVAQSTNTLPERRIAAPVRNEPLQVAQAPRVRPAAAAPAASATESGTNVSAAAVLPDAPQPYNTLNPSAAPAPIAPAAPAPVQAAPAPMPETPPVETPAAPATEAPLISPVS
ncbi:hypothetical protein [uncultured Phenylobacterium sp.]|uniref:hypothetical protein n=1 Tax=uncultured Phenylobacterium sp. TaxID=349273 RepID=UPI0025E27106|nr:hypothetical protein [uncultured Phenylobacterium sp.]